MRHAMTLAVGLAVLMAATAVRADWDLGDPYKMHFPQLPDPTGWDISITSGLVADDWQCSATGPVEDIHFWASWQRDLAGWINAIYATIYSNVPAGPNNPSHPGDVLWEARFPAGEFTLRPWDHGDQGWYDPVFGEWIPHDHQAIVQVNIPRIQDAFGQKEGEIYWLGLAADIDGAAQMGWKTSRDHFMDDAVSSPLDSMWEEIRDPLTGESLDLAFVITPEPATLALLGIGAVGFVARRRRRKGT